jgi:hypothetical protein
VPGRGDKPYAMTMVYEGDDSGTLKISGSSAI